MQWVGLSRETHIHCGANSGSSFGVRFELATCKFVFIHTQYLDWLAAIGDVFCLFVGLWGWTDAEDPTTKGWLRRISLSAAALEGALAEYYAAIPGKTISPSNLTIFTDGQYILQTLRMVSSKNHFGRQSKAFDFVQIAHG